MLFAAAARFLACTVTVLGLSYVFPGFAAGGFSGAIPTGWVAAAAGFVAEAFFAHRLPRAGRALVGLVTTATSAYIMQLLVPGMSVPASGAVLAGAVVGLVDFMVRTEVPATVERVSPPDD